MAEEALSCESVESTAALLELALQIGGNAELSEAFGQFIDTIVMTKTECFLNATLLMERDALRPLIRFYVPAPITEEGQEGVR